MAETAKKISMIPAKVQYDRNVKLSEKKMKVAADKSKERTYLIHRMQSRPAFTQCFECHENSQPFF